MMSLINLFNRNQSTNVTLPKPQRIHGVEVRKVPIGVYLSAMRELEGLPSDIINELFPGKTMPEIMAELTHITDDGIVRIATRLLVIAPKYVVNTLSLILGVDKDVIENQLTPKELCDIVKAYWALNDMTDFFGDVSALVKKLMPTLPSGSSAGSPLARASVFPSANSSKSTT